MALLAPAPTIALAPKSGWLFFFLNSINGAENQTFADPHFHADAPIRRMGRVPGEIDVGTERMERYTSFHVFLGARDFISAEAPAALHADPLRENLAVRARK